MAVGGSQLTATTRHTLIILLAHDPAVETSLIETGEARPMEGPNNAQLQAKIFRSSPILD